MSSNCQHSRISLQKSRTTSTYYECWACDTCGLLFSPSKAPATEQPDEAMGHLADVLCMLAELHPDDQCRAYVEALAYYNAKCPNEQIAPAEGYSSRIVTTGPLDRLLERESSKAMEIVRLIAEAAKIEEGLPPHDNTAPIEAQHARQVQLSDAMVKQIEAAEKAIELLNEIEGEK